MQKYSVNQHDVGAIINWVGSGEIAIPEIQRPFVWKVSKVRDFIDSLYQGYPVGYIISWRNPDIKLKDGSLSRGKKVLIDGQRLERLKDQYETGVLSSLAWLKGLLDAARKLVRLEKKAHEEVLPDDKQALTEIFREVKNDTTPQIIANVVEDIDKIVRATRFNGW